MSETLCPDGASALTLVGELTEQFGSEVHSMSWTVGRRHSAVLWHDGFYPQMVVPTHVLKPRGIRDRRIEVGRQLGK